MPTIDVKQAGISRVATQQAGDDDAKATQGKTVRPAKTDDVTKPSTPKLHYVAAFEIAPEGSTRAPPPTPNQPQNRDPIHIVLDDVELGATLQFISLSDDPAATFEKGEVFTLPITAYDGDQRRATVMLSAEMMQEKGLEPGERLCIRQVDDNGNASDGIFVHCDPSGWARESIDVPDGAGGTTSAQGATITYQVGLHNVKGADQLDVGRDRIGQSRTLIGLATTDKRGPRIVQENVRVLTHEWSADDKAIAHHLLHGPGVWDSIVNAFGGGTISLENAKKALADPASYSFDAKTFGILQRFVDEPELFTRIETAAYGPWTKDGIIGDVDLKEIDTNAKTTIVAMEHAREPGVTGTIHNNGTGEKFPFALKDDQRDCYVVVRGLETGHKLFIEYADKAGNAGKPLDFEYNAKAAGGRGKTSPLMAQIGAMVKDPLMRTLHVDGKQLKEVPGVLVGGLPGPAWIYEAKGGEKVKIISGFALEYPKHADALGLPLSDEKPTDAGAEQHFERGVMTWDRASNEITATPNPTA